MAVLTVVPTITVHGVAPLVRCLHRRAGGAPVLVLAGTPSTVLVVVELGAGVALPASIGSQQLVDDGDSCVEGLDDYLPAEPRWFLARFCFVICQDIRGVQPLGVVIQKASLLVEAVWSEPVLLAGLLHLSLLPAVVHGRPQVRGAVGEGTVGAILDAVAPVVGVVDTHARLVVA